MRLRRFLRNVLSILTVLILIAPVGMAQAEKERIPVWVLCQPDSYVNVRSKPSRKSQVEGYAYCGDGFETDGKTKNGFLHVYASTESGEGWISNGYVVYEEPTAVNETWIVESKGRLAARMTVNGKRRKWLKPGAKIVVYYVAEWAVTSEGFVRPEYIEPEERNEKHEGSTAQN